MNEIVICRGLPASGKTTFARKWVAEDPAGRARINKDDLRRSLHEGVYLGHETEKQINAVRDAAIAALLAQGVSVVSDDTNLPQKVARGIADLARRAGAEVRVEDFTGVPVEECVRRDGEREHAVGGEVIAGMAERFLGKGWPLPYPEPMKEPQGFAPYERTGNLPGAWLVDLDGTLALMGGGRSPFDWPRVVEDELNRPVAQVVRALERFGFQIVFVSGRDSVCRPETLYWLSRYGFTGVQLFMRAEGDTRKDAIVKRELLDKISEDWDVFGALDDRDSVVRMWRSVGLTCFQVAEGNF